MRKTSCAGSHTGPLAQWRRPPERPDELELEFAVKLGAKGGSAMFILAETSGEASFRICMRWTGGSAAGEALGQPQP